MAKLCPMKTNEHGNNPKECNTDSCGWWSRTHERCAITAIADNINNENKYSARELIEAYIEGKDFWNGDDRSND